MVELVNQRKIYKTTGILTAHAQRYSKELNVKVLSLLIKAYIFSSTIVFFYQIILWLCLYFKSKKMSWS